MSKDSNLIVPLYKPSDALGKVVEKNMALWEQVWVTPPQITKGFKKRGFRGSAIDPQQQRKLITAIFGPKGVGWGIDNVNLQIFNPETFHAFAQYQATFWFEFSADKVLWGQWAGKRGQFPVVASMQLWQQSTYPDKATGKPSWFFKEDYAKILATDAMTKAISELGFCSDVFEGGFDNVKYLLDIEDYFAQTYPNLTDSRDDAERAALAAERKRQAQAGKQQKNQQPPKGSTGKEVKQFTYAGPNRDRVLGYLSQGQTVEQVVGRITKLGFAVSQAVEQEIKADFDSLAEQKAAADTPPEQ